MYQSKIIEGFFTEWIVPEIAGRHCIVVTDRNVEALFRDRFPVGPRVVLRPGERQKTLPTVEYLYRAFMEHGVDRHSLILGVGGGVVTDMTGFAASTYMRGIPFAFAPTTLLAQVDAAHGGKNGIDFNGYKNLVGTFAPAEFILLDFSFLQTLPEREFRCGASEMIKIAAISDIGLFEQMENRSEVPIFVDNSDFRRMAYRSIQGKLDIVSADATERGKRKLLNFGHTVGHALERMNGLPHGEAVALGMIVEAELAVSWGVLSQLHLSRLKDLLSKFGLPTRAEYDPDALCDNITKDKKKKRADIDFVLLTSLGKARIRTTAWDELRGALHDLR